MLKKYDFRHPNKLSNEQMRTLQIIFENLSRILTTTLSTHLRNMVNFEVLSIEQLAYAEFIKTLPEPSIIGISDLEPLNGQFICEINPGIGFAIIDLLFGGLGKEISSIRPFTDIEQVVLKKVLNWILNGYAEAWENIMKVKPRLREIESNPQFTQIVHDNDMTIIIKLSASIAECKGLLNFCIPYIMLEPIAANLSAQHWFASTGGEQTKEHVQRLKKRLQKAPVRVFAELGKADLTVADILHLQCGDIIKLDKRVNDPVDIRVGNNIKYKAKAGTRNKYKAFKITEIVADTGEEST